MRLNIILTHFSLLKVNIYQRQIISVNNLFVSVNNLSAVMDINLSTLKFAYTLSGERIPSAILFRVVRLRYDD